MEEIVTEMVAQLKQLGVPKSKIEIDLGFSNGLIGKGTLSIEKFNQLCEYYAKFIDAKSQKTEWVFKIYSITNPITNKVFYIGNTRASLNTRLGAHISESVSQKKRSLNTTKKQDIINGILDKDELPIITCLEEIKGSLLCQTTRLALEAENKWILKMLKGGAVLTNKQSRFQKHLSKKAAETKLPLEDWEKELEAFFDSHENKELRKQMCDEIFNGGCLITKQTENGVEIIKTGTNEWFDVLFSKTTIEDFKKSEQWDKIYAKIKVNNLPENKSKILAERNAEPKPSTKRVYPLTTKGAIPRLEGESSLDYRIRCEELAKLQSNQ